MNVKMLVMDVDGTLTDGKIYIDSHGEAMKGFNVKDGYGIVYAVKRGIVPVIITGRKSKIVENRAKELGITELYQGVGDKLVQLKKIANQYQIGASEIAYIGDDLNDLECINFCGITGCPADAVEEVKIQVDIICDLNGGNGAVREFIDKVTQLEK